MKSNWQQFWAKKILKIFWDFWGQKFRNYVILYAQKWICVVVCSIKNVYWRLKVIGENNKTCENNLATILSKQKNFEIFLRFLRSEISKVRHFICPKNGFPPTSRWCKKFSRGAMKTNKNSCETWDIRLSKAPTLVSIRPLEKKCWPFFEKTGFVSTL